MGVRNDRVAHAGEHPLIRQRFTSLRAFRGEPVAQLRHRAGRVHDARNAVVRSARLHSLMWQKRAYARDVLAKAHNAIACKLDKPDCQAKVPQIIGYRPMNDVLPPDLSRKAMSPTGK